MLEFDLSGIHSSSHYNPYLPGKLAYPPISKYLAFDHNQLARFGWSSSTTHSAISITPGDVAMVGCIFLFPKTWKICY